MTHSRRLPAAVLAVITTAALVMVGAAPASAAPSDGYATWTTAGSAGNFTGTLTLPAGFPVTTLTSTSPALPVSGGTSRFLPPDTPAGQLVGSSYGKP